MTTISDNRNVETPRDILGIAPLPQFGGFKVVGALIKRIGEQLVKKKFRQR